MSLMRVPSMVLKQLLTDPMEVLERFPTVPMDRVLERLPTVPMDQVLLERFPTVPMDWQVLERLPTAPIESDVSVMVMVRVSYGKRVEP